MQCKANPKTLVLTLALIAFIIGATPAAQLLGGTENIAYASSVQITSTQQADDTSAYNCVNQAKYVDPYWSKHLDAIVGPAKAAGIWMTARDNNWVVDGNPEDGDMVIWEAGAGDGRDTAGPDGHLAINVKTHNGLIDVREENWPLGAPPHVRHDVKPVSRMHFVHKRKWATHTTTETFASGGTHLETYRTGSHWALTQVASRTELVQVAVRWEQYIIGYRTESYFAGFQDHWVTRNRRRVNDRQAMYRTRQIAIYSSRPVATYASRQVPVYGWKEVPTYGTRWAPNVSTRQVTRTIQQPVP